MVSLKEFFNRSTEEAEKGIAHKNNLIKRNIIAYMAINGQCTLAELTKELHISIPTITKLVGELVAEALVTDNGKVETPGGRRPNIFGLANTAIYFAGVDISRDGMRFLITDLKNNIITYRKQTDYELKDSPASLEAICANIEQFLDTCGIDRGKILGLGVCIAGRVNPKTGRSYKYFTSSPKSLCQLIEERSGIQVLLENDTRARCYAEYFGSDSRQEKDVLYLHLGRGGVAIGIVADSHLYYGKSGFAGEFGHVPFFDNEVICACGKKGCLETEVSGIAIENKLISLVRAGVNTTLRAQAEKQGAVHIYDIIAAAKNDDNLSIELIGEAGEKIGRSVAFLINIFNPELVIIGGHLAAAEDILTLPLKASASKYSLSLVCNDTKFRLSAKGDEGGALGAAMLIRNKIIGL
ncbi:MAG: ROK family transcriptional regulator [Rikenellaceae bacterium]|jgi:predicted NBD/HSP70 family sugar kinase|nr:ROK family transcriptional regulator [Rikenellaceae bacterium]